MSHSLNEHNNIIFNEMMSHPVLFTHPQPKKVMIIDDNDSLILQEVLKHNELAEIIFVSQKNNCANETNSKLTVYSNDSTEWIKKIIPHSLDIIIHAGLPSNALLNHFFTLLSADGILIQQSTSPFEMLAVKSLADQLRSAAFKEQHLLHFPQPGFAFGWRSIIMATKQAGFKRIREKAVFSRSFKTYYYNLDTHKASFVLPEFMREEWVS